MAIIGHPSAQLPIAIIGLSCRLAPNLTTPETFWEFLTSGRSAVSTIPVGRWEPFESSNSKATARLRHATRRAAWLQDIAGFDADFFGVSRREAVEIDPQQRFILELAWEGLERAGISPTNLAGSDVAVYVAANSFDYGRRLFDDLADVSAWALNGGLLFGLANRVSYLLDLHGPSVTVDTACAGSLTALHLAVRALEARETELALAAGVTLMSDPAMVLSLDAAGATAADGRSKAFDASADGYGRGEGAGLVVLKRLEDAQRDGDPVLAVIRGTGLAQDGRTEGMMAPNGAAQERLLRMVYERAAVDPSTIDYVEAHGTGTPAGDGVELGALARVLGTGRRSRRCLVGSVKPNVGHTEAAAGFAGLIKTVLALQHEELPPSLHERPHPSVPWGENGLQLVASRTPWPRSAEPRRAGVSCFGVGGVIAHAVLEEAPAAVEVRPDVKTREGLPLLLSGRSAEALQQAAERLATWWRANPGATVVDVTATLALRRPHLSHRLAVPGAGREQLLTVLEQVAAGCNVDAVTRGESRPVAGGAVWVFSGHGAQWSGMGADLLDVDPGFTAVVDELDPIYREELGWGVREAIAAGDFSRASTVQAMTFAMQAALAEALRRRGVRPAAVITHSVGEIAAAVVAGALELPAAGRFAARRARAIGTIEGFGAMAMVQLPFETLVAELAGYDDLCAAVDAGPGSSVMSGDVAAVAAMSAQFEQRNVLVHSVRSNVAFHSRHLDKVVDDIAQAAAELMPRSPQLPMYRSTLIDPRGARLHDSAYWVLNARQPVLFDSAVRAAARDGHRTFLEVSSHPVVAHSVREILVDEQIVDASVVAIMRRGLVAHIDSVVRDLHVGGTRVEWDVSAPSHYRLQPLPTTAWQHRRYWHESSRREGTGRGHDPELHTLLGARSFVPAEAPATQWRTHLELESRPYPLRHPVHGVEIVPAAVLLETFMAAARDGGIDEPTLVEVQLRTPIAVETPREIAVTCQRDRLRITSRVTGDDKPVTAEAGDDWTSHTLARVSPQAAARPPAMSIETIRAACLQIQEWDDLQRAYRRRGVAGYGFDWRVKQVYRGPAQLLTTVFPSPSVGQTWAETLDAALTMAPLLMPDDDVLRMPMRMTRVTLFAAPPEAPVMVHVLRPDDGRPLIVDVRVATEKGDVLAELQGVQFGVLADSSFAPGPRLDALYRTTWVPIEEREGVRPGRVLLMPVAEVAGSGHELAAALRRIGCEAEVADDLKALAGGLAWGPDEVLLLVGHDPATELATCAERAEQVGWSCVEAVRAAIQLTTEADRGRVWVVTQGVAKAATAGAVAAATAWGVARIAAGEHPDRWGGLLDLDDCYSDSDTPLLWADAVAGRILAAVVIVEASQDVVRVDTSTLRAARLEAIPTEGLELGRRVGSDMLCDPAATYLVTGGLGALGLLVAQWLVRRGATRLLLFGRRPLPTRRQWGDPNLSPEDAARVAAVGELEAAGVTVRCLSVDVSDPAEVAAALESAADLPPVRGVVHAAGLAGSGLLRSLDHDQFVETLRPKASGAVALARALRADALDFEVQFSSCGQLARLTGQTAYAAANSFLDAWARWRVESGAANASSVGWMSWDDLGMSSGIEATIAQAGAAGFGPVSPKVAFDAWSQAARAGEVNPIVFTPTAAIAASASGLLVDLAASAAQGHEGDIDSSPDWITSSPEELEERLGDDLRVLVATELRRPPGELPPHKPLSEMGMDSVMIISLRTRIKKTYGVDLPPTILWSHPSLMALTASVLQQLTKEAA